MNSLFSEFTSEFLFSCAALIFVVVGMVSAAVRYFHVCGPYSADADVLFPSRKWMTIFFLGALLEIPYVLAPMNTSVYTFCSLSSLLFYPAAMSIAFEMYLGVNNPKYKVKRMVIMSVYLLIIVALFTALILGRDLQQIVTNQGFLSLGIALIAVFGSLYYVGNMFIICVGITRFNSENYSDSSDFPYELMRLMFPSSILVIALFWFLYLVPNQWLKFICDMLFSFIITGVLIYILNPHKKAASMSEVGKDIEIVKGNISESKTAYSFDDAEIEQEVIEAVLATYKQPHLVKSDLMARFDWSKKGRADKFISEVGFYNLINMFRLEHARLYKEKFPDATQDYLAEVSGFSSRFMLRRARMSVVIKPEYVKNITLSA